MAIFFTSDIHFDSWNVIERLQRPFKDLDEMHETIITNWNNTVGDGDRVYVLGDLSNSSAYKTEKFLERLNGDIFLIQGNHDIWTNSYKYKRLSWIRQYHKLHHNGMEFILFHFPIAVWEHRGRKSIHLHGHTHHDQHLRKLSYNVGVDVNNFTPVSVDEILEKINYEEIYREYINSIGIKDNIGGNNSAETN